MRSIVKGILAAPMPVIVFVAPSGGRAASAGAYITLAAHAAGMAPGTNIGSASPVQMGGAGMDSTMARKVTNDAAAYIASLARQRGRDEELARRMVTEAINLTASEARAAGLVDAVAASVPALLDSLQGHPVAIGEDRVPLALSGAARGTRLNAAPRPALVSDSAITPVSPGASSPSPPSSEKTPSPCREAG